jgi:hypothetical protein
MGWMNKRPAYVYLSRLTSSSGLRAAVWPQRAPKVLRFSTLSTDNSG